MTNPARDSFLVAGKAPNDAGLLSVVFGCHYAVDPASGRAEKRPGFALQTECVTHEGIEHRGTYRPALIQRDLDVWAWRSFTDLVVQGIARSDKPVTSLDVKLSCRGKETRIEREILVTGDRFVDRGEAGLRLSDPAPFTEMPMRYDKAYGGTDERAEDKFADRAELKLLRSMMTEEEFLQASEYSYPRNPPGKGYLIDPESAVGLPWPNLEFPDDRLSLSKLALPLERWGERPYPACFDWFSHGWFPRCAFFGESPATEGDAVPNAEVALGILPANLFSLPLLARPKHGFAQGAHPFLCRNRLAGDEEISISAMSRNTRPFRLVLPRARPTVHLRLPTGPEHVLPAALDLVFVETERQWLTLVWRASLLLETEQLLRLTDLDRQCHYRIDGA